MYTLGRTPDGWFLVAANGSARPATGLENAEPLDMTRDGFTRRVVCQPADLGGHLSAVAVQGSTVLVVGAHLTLERAPRERLVLRRTPAGWSVVAPAGLEYTREWEASAVAAGPDGRRLSTVDENGSMVATCRDGLGWAPGGQVADAAVRSLAVTGAGVRWVANAMGGSGGITGVVGAGRRPVPVPQDAQALGAIGGRSCRLADGRIGTATI